MSKNDDLGTQQFSPKIVGNKNKPKIYRIRLNFSEEKYEHNFQLQKLRYFPSGTDHVYNLTLNGVRVWNS